MKTVTLILLGVVLAASPGSSAHSNRSGVSVEAYGLSIQVPDGWQARVYRLTAEDAITLEASSAELPPQGELMTGDRLRPGDVYIWISDIGTAPGTPPESWGESSLPLTVGPDDIQGPYENGFATGAGFSALVNDRPLNVSVRFGSQLSLDDVNDVLATFTAAPR